MKKKAKDNSATERKEKRELVENHLEELREGVYDMQSILGVIVKMSYRLDQLMEQINDLIEESN